MQRSVIGPARNGRSRLKGRWAGVLLLLSGCAASPPPCGPLAGEAVTVVSRGWHTAIGIPASALRGPLARFRGVYPGARTVMFGYGKRTFLTARADRWDEYLIGPFPGPAVIETAGLSTEPQAAYGPEDSIDLVVPPEGMDALSASIWNDLAKDASEAPRLVARGAFPGSLMYAAVSTYNLANTCNTWAARALRAAGLPISPEGVVLSGQLMGRAADAALRQCRGR